MKKFAMRLFLLPIAETQSGAANSFREVRAKGTL